MNLVILSAALSAAHATPPVDAHPRLPSRTTTFVVDATQSTGKMENFREIWVSPARVGATLAPTGEADPAPVVDPAATSLPIRNSTGSYATITVNGVELGVVDAFTNAAVHGVTPGLYEVKATLQNGFAETRTVATRVIDGPLTPGSADGVAYTEAPAPRWSEAPADGYTPAPPPPPPPAPMPRIALESDRVSINERVQFATGSATIDARSHGLLDELTALVVAHPELLLLEIQGHTDATGDAAANRALSQARAEAVQAYLVAAGVAPARLQAQGYGPDRPRFTGDDAASLARNRRVEIHVVERVPEGIPTEAAPPVPPAPEN